MQIKNRIEKCFTEAVSSCKRISDKFQQNCKIQGWDYWNLYQNYSLNFQSSGLLSFYPTKSLALEGALTPGFINAKGMLLENLDNFIHEGKHKAIFINIFKILFKSNVLSQDLL